MDMFVYQIDKLTILIGISFFYTIPGIILMELKLILVCT